MDSITQEIKSIISNIVEIDENKIEGDLRFVEDLGIDSMMALEILASIEKNIRLK